MRDKINSMNADIGLKTLPLCLAFCLFPFDIVVDAIDSLL